MDKRIFLKKILAAGIVTGSIASYPFLIEANMILKSEISVKIEGIKDNITIAHITDLHIKGYGLREKEAVKQINEIKKDLIAITGDFIGNREGIKYLKMFLSELENNISTYAVLGNWDHWSDCVSELKNTLESYNIKLLVNENVKESVNRNEFYIAGVDDPYTEHSNIKKALDNIEKGKSIILLAHSPQIIDDAASNNINLALVGHTHGGQVKIPLLGAPFIPLPEPYKKFYSGQYKVGNIIMYVNRGIGTSILNVRLLCPPEVAAIKVYD